MSEYRIAEAHALIPLGTTGEIACNLEPGLVADRVDDWKVVLEQAEDRQALSGGVRILFPRDINVAAIAELAAAEQTCCQFFNFSIAIGRTAVSLDVTGSEAAQPVIDSLFGVAS